MNISITGSVSRGGIGLASYLTGTHDHKGERRDYVEVLEGDPFMVGDLADSLSFKHKMTHMSVAWHPDDTVTKEALDETIRTLKALAFAGLDEDRMCYAIIKHGEPNGSFHIHLMIAKVDLLTGKAFNPAPASRSKFAPPLWLKPYGSWRDMLNEKYRWKSPKDDPEPASIDKMALLGIVQHCKDQPEAVDTLKQLNGVEIDRIRARGITVIYEGEKIRLDTGVCAPRPGRSKKAKIKTNDQIYSETAKGKEYNGSAAHNYEKIRAKWAERNIKKYGIIPTPDNDFIQKIEQESNNHAEPQRPRNDELGADVIENAARASRKHRSEARQSAEGAGRAAQFNGGLKRYLHAAQERSRKLTDHLSRFRTAVFSFIQRVIITKPSRANKFNRVKPKQTQTIKKSSKSVLK